MTCSYSGTNQIHNTSIGLDVGTCCVFDSSLSKSKSFTITRGTHSRSFLETCCVFNSLLRRSKSFSITRDTHSRPVLWTCCVFDSFLSRSKSFSITRGTHSRSFLGTCCVFDSSLCSYSGRNQIHNTSIGRNVNEYLV
jgi:hypothetical protein